jgi:hypothetical protein
MCTFIHIDDDSSKRIKTNKSILKTIRSLQLLRRLFILPLSLRHRSGTRFCNAAALAKIPKELTRLVLGVQNTP